eukprot:gene12113-26257_t
MGCCDGKPKEGQQQKPKAEKGKTVDQVIKGWSKDRQT